MPVLGHAVAGWALARVIRPTPGFPLARPGLVDYWTPGLIAVAFLPDIASQAALAAGSSDPTPVTHSIPVAAAAAVLLAAVFARGAGFAPSRALLLTALLVPGHVLLDLLQSPWRAPFWPFGGGVSSLAAIPPPLDARLETLVSASAAVAVLALRRGRAAPRPRPRPRPTALAATVALVVCAGLTHHLRGKREASYHAAIEHLKQGDPAAALRLADAADGWPRPTRPGRIDYVRAEALLALGERQAARRHLERSVAADPGYFWTWADLCLLEATGDAPLEERRRRARPCLDTLEARFGGHPDLVRMAAKVSRALDAAPRLNRERP